MERTQIQERIEEIVSNELMCATPFQIKSSRINTQYWRELGPDSEEDLQRSLCMMDYKTAKLDEKRMALYREWLKMMNNLYLKFMKLSEEGLYA